MESRAKTLKLILVALLRLSAAFHTLSPFCLRTWKFNTWQWKSILREGWLLVSIQTHEYHRYVYIKLTCLAITRSSISTFALTKTVDPVRPPRAGSIAEHPCPSWLGTVAGTICSGTCCIVLAFAIITAVDAIRSRWTGILTFTTQMRKRD